MLKQTPAESMLGLEVSTVTGFHCGAYTKKSLMPKAEKSRDRLVVSEKQICNLRYLRVDPDCRRTQTDITGQLQNPLPNSVSNSASG